MFFIIIFFLRTRGRDEDLNKGVSGNKRKKRRKKKKENNHENLMKKKREKKLGVCVSRR